VRSRNLLPRFLLIAGVFLLACALTFKSAQALSFFWSFVDAVQVVAHKLASPRCYLASTIEELAAHAILGYARDLLGDDVDAAVRWGIADAERAGADAEELQAEVFEDEDALMLFDPSFDGIENSTIVASMGAVGLAFDDWFKPYPLARSWL
jgi:hypothetical protein